MSNRLFAVREYIEYESRDIIALFSTMDKAVDYLNRHSDNHYELVIERVLVDSDDLIEVFELV